MNKNLKTTLKAWPVIAAITIGLCFLTQRVALLLGFELPDQQNVEVQGQVMYAGLYALTKQNERISDLITKAGGLKQFAYAKGASLLRRLTPDEIFQLQQQTNQK